MVDNISRVGNVIRLRRESRGVRQTELAQYAGVGHAYISKIEHGRETPSEDVIERIATRLDLDVDELILMTGRVPAHFVRALCAEPQSAVDHLRAFVDVFKSDSGSGAGCQSQGQEAGGVPPRSLPEGTLTSPPAGAPDVGGTNAGGAP